MPRQIIKTRPQGPYVAARIVILVIVLALGATFAWFESHHAVRAGLALQEPIFVSLNSPSPLIGR
jgi:hypothetical protein